MDVTYETDTTVLALGHEMYQGLVRDSQLTPPQDEVSYRALFQKLGATVVERGIFDSTAPALQANPITRRKIATVAGLPTILEQHLIHLDSQMRQDVMSGFLGPFDRRCHHEQLCRTLLAASRRQHVEKQVKSPVYDERDFALAISYKHRDREICGGTLNEMEAEILVDFLIKIIASVPEKRVWVWFDQQLTTTVPNIEESKWYRFGAIPYIVLPVLRYVNVSMLGKKPRPWLVFEECAAQNGSGYWSVARGLYPSHISPTYGLYVSNFTEKHVLYPGSFLRWQSAMVGIIRYFWSTYWDTLLEGYEYTESFKEFMSWATLIGMLQVIPDTTKLPWNYRMEKSVSSVLDRSTEETVTDSPDWSDAHIKLMETVQGKARKLLVPDINNGDMLKPAFTGSDFVALRLFDGAAISDEHGELKLVEPKERSILQGIADSATFKYQTMHILQDVARVYYPDSGDFRLLLVKISADVCWISAELGEMITSYDDPIEVEKLRSSDWPCYVSYLACRDMGGFIWRNRIFYVWRERIGLLQVELLSRDIVAFGADVKLQAMIGAADLSNHIKIIRECTYVATCHWKCICYSSIYFSRWETSLHKPVMGAFCDGDSDSIKALLGLLPPDEVPALHPCYPLLHGTKEGEEFIEAAEMDLRVCGKAGEYVCGVNGLKCFLSRSSHPRCQWQITWGDLYEEPTDDFPVSDIQGTVGADLDVSQVMINSHNEGSLST